MDLHRVHYLDASVLVKLVVQEDGTNAIKEYMRSERTSGFHATSLCFAEALGVLKYKYLGGRDRDENAYFTAGDELSRCINDDIELVDLNIADSAIFDEVEKIAKQYRLDIVDAHQIVTIKKDPFSGLPHSRPILVTADSRLAEAACKEGLIVWNCLKGDPP